MKRYADGFAPSLPVTARRTPTIAIAHDQLTSRGAAERVVLAMLRAFPKATVYTTRFDPEATFAEFRHADVRVCREHRGPFLRRPAHRAAPVLPRLAGLPGLPGLPMITRAMHIDADVVLCSSRGLADEVRTSGRKLVYSHGPTGWLGAAAERRGIRRSAGAPAPTPAVPLPTPGALAADGRSVEVTDLVDWAGCGFALVMSPLVSGAQIEQVIEAFRGLTQRLVVVGDGPLASSLRADLPVNVRIVGELDDARSAWVHEQAGLLIDLGREMLGRASAEPAATFGLPTVALRTGRLERVREGRTGLFFDAVTPGQIREAVCRAAARTWDRQAIRAHAEEFSEARFRTSLRAAVADLALA
jgi:hypothetical protein